MAKKAKADHTITMERSTITITFGDRGENHAGMQIIGDWAPSGFSREDLIRAQEKFENEGFTCEFIDLRDFAGDDEEVVENVDQYDSACILIIRNGVNAITDANELFTEQAHLPVDTKVYMRGAVKNKLARHNLCFSDFDQEPDYENGKGRIIKFSHLKYTNEAREGIKKFLHKEGTEWWPLIAEGNYYYDNNKCYIGFHGDSERKRVVALRLGHAMNIVYQWHLGTQLIGNVAKFNLNHGDMYIMGEKAVGTDWKKRSIYTLRHAAGKKFD